MKNLRKLPLLTLCCFLFIFFAQSCSKKEEAFPPQVEKKLANLECGSEDDFKSNLFKRKFARTLELAMVKNGKLRSFIKKKALERIDGDYDVPVGLIVNSKIFKNKTFIELIAETASRNYIFFGKSTNKRKQIKALRRLIKNHKALQIAVPVNIEDWNPKKFTPLTAALTTVNDGENTLIVEAYNRKGFPVFLSSRITPAVPVVVVGNCERGYVENGKFVRPNRTTSGIVPYSDCDRDVDVPQGDDLTRDWYFEQFRFDDLRAVEAWSAGAPEIYIYVANPCGAKINYFENVEPPKDNDIMNTWWSHRLHAVLFANDNENPDSGFTREMEVLCTFLEVDGTNAILDGSDEFEFQYYGTKRIGGLPQDNNGDEIGYFFLAKDKIGEQSYEPTIASSAGGFRVMVSGTTY